MDFTLISRNIIGIKLWTMSTEARLVWLTIVTLSEGDREYAANETALPGFANMTKSKTSWAVEQLILEGYLGRSADGLWLTEESLKYVRSPEKS